MRRYIALGMLVTTITLYPAFTQASPSSNGTLSCGLGLPPGTLGFAEAEAKLALEAKKKGYLRVCDADLERFRISFLPLATEIKNLAFQPVALASTEFASFVSLGGKVEPVSAVRSRLYRGFRTSEGHIVTLLEHDMSADGSSMHRAPQDELELINGSPARLSVFQTPAGKAISHLSWMERRRFYELWIDTNVFSPPLRDRFFAMAASLPPSVPACPNERVPEPMRIGNDGFPVPDPSPKTMTRAQMDARFQGHERPCKQRHGPIWAIVAGRDGP